MLVFFRMQPVDLIFMQRAKVRREESMEGFQFSRLFATLHVKMGHMGRRGDETHSFLVVSSFAG